MYHVTLVVCPCWAVSSVGLLSHPADASRQILFLKKKDANPFFLLPSPLAEAQGNTKKCINIWKKMTRSMSAARGYMIRRCRPFPARREYGPEVKGRGLSDGDDRPPLVP